VAGNEYNKGMANIKKSNSRERKNHKARTGMRVSGRSVFVIQAVQIKKGQGK
jgi:hypothetical protein